MNKYNAQVVRFDDIYFYVHKIKKDKYVYEFVKLCNIFIMYAHKMCMCVPNNVRRCNKESAIVCWITNWKKDKIRLDCQLKN